MSMTPIPKPVIGISCGDLNGIGLELIIKTFSDTGILELCTHVIFASNKTINFYRKSMPDINFKYKHAKEIKRLNIKQDNLFNCWEEETEINTGQLNESAGIYAMLTFQAVLRA